MQILNSTIEDLEEIFNLYKIATQFQIMKSLVPWLEFERSLIIKEVNENRQWKILVEDKIACIWATCFTDSLIWEKRNNDPAVYPITPNPI